MGRSNYTKLIRSINDNIIEYEIQKTILQAEIVNLIIS